MEEGPENNSTSREQGGRRMSALGQILDRAAIPTQTPQGRYLSQNERIELLVAFAKVGGPVTMGLTRRKAGRVPPEVPPLEDFTT
jgi:hypothetical protein